MSGLEILIVLGVVYYLLAINIVGAWGTFKQNAPLILFSLK